MSVYTRVSGTWREVEAPSVRVSGTWRDVDEQFVRVGGTWRSVYQSLGPDTEIGTFIEGGYFAGTITVDGNDFALICSPTSGHAEDKQWKTDSGSYTPGTSSTVDGYTNSYNMNNTDHPAAYFCCNLTINGYSDWYLPAKDELDMLYQNQDVLGGFYSTAYWSSTEHSEGKAWMQNFGSGVQTDSWNTNYHYVRAVRRVLL